jgi:hypothetical protein
MSEKLTVTEAAKIMGITPQVLRLGLRREKFPFGVGVLVDKRWSYYINAERFRKYMRGEDMRKEGIS